MKITKTGIVIYLLLAGAFALAVLQPMGESPDYANYELFFQEVRRDLSYAAGYRFEPGFGYAAGWLAGMFTSDLIVYGVLMATGLVVKLYYVRAFGNRDTPSGRYFLYAALVLYLCKFFALHELTQLRVSIAAGALLACVYYLWTSRRLSGVVAAIVAVSFHYSSLILLPFMAIPRMTRRQALGFALLSYVVLRLGSLVALSVAQQYFAVFATYDLDVVEQAIKPLSPVFLPEYFMIAMGVRYWDDLTEIMRRVVVIELIGFVLLFVFIDFPVIAVRGREFFSVLWIVFITQAGQQKVGLKVAIHVFIGASLALGLYQFVVLDFFSR